jgi:ribosomal protein S16
LDLNTPSRLVGFCQESHVVRIRMKRMGRPHRPFYRISAIEKTVRRDGKVLENLGTYDTMMDLLVKQNIVDGTEWKAHRADQAVRRKARAEAAAAAAPAKKK